MRRLTSLLLGSTFIAVLMGPNEARSDLTFCNRVTETVSVSFKYWTRNLCPVEQWRRVGWYNLAPEECRAVLIGDLSYNPLDVFYFYALSSSLEWAGSVQEPTCIQWSAFSECDDNCQNPPLGPYVRYREICTLGRTHCTINLVE
jgi:uncharacterized membrane protein